jgi:hypothetical protein
MKTYLTYGFLKALTYFLLTLLVFVGGLQSDAAHLMLGGWILGLGRLVIAIVFITLGIRARRSSVPSTEEFSYGWAFQAGFAIQAFSSLFSAGFTYLYAAVINPNLTDVMLQAQAQKLQAGGMSDDQIEHVQHMTRLFSGPAMQAAETVVGGLIFGAIIALIAAAFLKREAAEPPLA